jgi:hypothetical protein
MPAPRRIPQKPVGFRLANELEGLLQGIRADGVINEQETARLRRWLDENYPYRSIQPFSEIAIHLDRVLDDGVVTLDECDDLLFVIRKLTTVNPHFNALRSGLQVMMGLLTGVAADDALGDAEVAALNTWLEEWEHLRGLWPYDECCAIVTDAIINRQATDAHRDYLLSLAAQVPIAGADDEIFALPLVVKGICAIDPSIEFPRRTFSFTGESLRADRQLLETAVKDRGGLTSPRISKSVDYLVVCDGGSQFWAFSCYGRKVEEAYKLRRDGHHVVIAHETDFWDAVAGTGLGV